jgi:hypothetical protein
MRRDPVRMLDDASAPDRLRSDLAEAAAQPPMPIDMTAGLARLQASIAASSAAGGTAAAAKAAAMAQGSWWGAALIGTALGLVGAVVIWFAPVGPSPSAPPVPAIEATAAPPVLVAPPPPVATIPAPAETGSGVAARAALPAKADAPRAAVSAAASADPVDPAAEELALLVRIKEKAASDPAGAIALVDEGHQRFPRGGFYLERESIAVLALAQLGRTAEARERAKRVLEAHPGNAYAERLRGIAEGAP